MLARDVGLSLQTMTFSDHWKSRCSIAETKDEINSQDQDGSGIEHLTEEEMDERNAADFMKRKGGVNQIVTYIPFLEPTKLPRTDAVQEILPVVVQIPIRSKFNMKCDVEEIEEIEDVEDVEDVEENEEINGISANHLHTSLSPSSIDIDASTGLPSNRVLKTSTSEPSLSMIPLIARCPTDKPCPLSMAPRRRTEQRSLKNQTRYTTPANQILCME